MHWTLIGFETKRDITARQKGLRIHRVGAGSELEDESGHFRDPYGLASGEWVLVRPDGYVATSMTADSTALLQSFFAEVGLTGNDSFQY